MSAKKVFKALSMVLKGLKVLLMVPKDFQGLPRAPKHSALRCLKNIFGFFAQDVVSSVER